MPEQSCCPSGVLMGPYFTHPRGAPSNFVEHFGEPWAATRRVLERTSDTYLRFSLPKSITLPPSLTMFSRAVALFALALPLLATAAQPCGEGTQPYCCRSNSMTPKGYVGDQCTGMQTVNDTCRGGASVMCCEQMNSDGQAYYCAAPQTA
ncbi:hypothetical protein LshimejAT787_0605650 [Lyophyllum shimeji]|uniref:Hydrophobin n=1 Tax=Lyophyllum shimeji TaxID=47721 RepID=A0A9P3PP00_LYOSH|nr:hypothetical protein LshimejAT787_0605650 [Lyophyllum shimeji]